MAMADYYYQTEIYSKASLKRDLQIALAKLCTPMEIYISDSTRDLSRKDSVR